MAAYSTTQFNDVSLIATSLDSIILPQGLTAGVTVPLELTNTSNIAIAVSVHLHHAFNCHLAIDSAVGVVHTRSTVVRLEAQQKTCIYLYKIPSHPTACIAPGHSLLCAPGDALMLSPVPADNFNGPIEGTFRRFLILPISQ